MKLLNEYFPSTTVYAGAVATPELSPFQRTPSESVGVTTSPDEFLMSEENFVAFSSLVPPDRR